MTLDEVTMNDSEISVLVPVYQPDLEHFAEAVASVMAQTIDSWELIIVLDGPHDPGVRAIADVEADRRITVLERAHNGGIAAASADGLARAGGEFIALLDQDDTLAAWALEAMSEAIGRWPDADVLYSDEDKLAFDGRRIDPFCKPAFSPERLRSHMYLGHLGVYRRSLVEEIGGFRPGFDGSQDHDLALRATERARRVVHVPEILYHWRMSAGSTAAVPESKDWAYEAGVRAVSSHIERIGMQAVASRDPVHSGVISLTPAITDAPKVSVIVPTGGGRRYVSGEEVSLIDRCITSIVEQTTYPDFEVVVVVDANAPGVLEERVRALAPDHVRAVRNPRPFNFSEACNLGRDHSLGQVLVFLNDDTEIVTSDWLERFVMHATLEGVGVVGAKLLYSDGTLQHIGLIARAGGVGHRHSGEAEDLRGGFESFVVQSNLLAVTGACIAVVAERFDRVGGFSAAFPLAFNDVDLCLKLYRAGLRTVLDPQIVVVHHESSTRNPAVSAMEIDLMHARWRELLHDDPYDNPSLRTYGYEQLQPPAALLEMRERVNGRSAEPRSWPPG